MKFGWLWIDSLRRHISSLLSNYGRIHENDTFKQNLPLDKLAKLYMDKIVSQYGIPLSIVSDRDLRFTFKFWPKLQAALGTKLRFSTAFHSQTDGQSERIIQTLEDMLRVYVLQFKGSWDERLSFIEFAYNNNYHSSIEIAPFEALYRRHYKMPICWEEVSERKLYGPELIQTTTENIKVIKENLKIARDRQKSYANNRRNALEFKVG